MSAINIPLSVGFYLAGGETDPVKIATGTAGTVALSFFPVGPLSGYSIDIFRDLFGVKECDRKTYPQNVKNLGRRGKLVVAVGILATTIATMGLIYNVSDRLNPPHTDVSNYLENTYKQ